MEIKLSSLEAFSPPLQDHYTRQQRALWAAYAPDLQALPLYTWSEGAAVIFGRRAILSGKAGDAEVLAEFLGFLQPEIIEGTPEIIRDLQPFIKGFRPLKRTAFALKASDEEMHVEEHPRLDDVYSILATGFPLAHGYYQWLTHSSLMERRGGSRHFLSGHTTVTRVYALDGFAFYSQVATHPDFQGEGTARKLLAWLGNKDLFEGNKGFLFALEERVGFYMHAGLKPVGEDVILEKIREG